MYIIKVKFFHKSVEVLRMTPNIVLLTLVLLLLLDNFWQRYSRSKAEKQITDQQQEIFRRMKIIRQLRRHQ